MTTDGYDANGSPVTGDALQPQAARGYVCSTCGDEGYYLPGDAEGGVVPCDDCNAAEIRKALDAYGDAERAVAVQPPCPAGDQRAQVAWAEAAAKLGDELHAARMALLHAAVRVTPAPAPQLGTCDRPTHDGRPHASTHACWSWRPLSPAPEAGGDEVKRSQERFAKEVEGFLGGEGGTCIRVSTCKRDPANDCHACPDFLAAPSSSEGSAVVGIDFAHGPDSAAYALVCHECKAVHPVCEHLNDRIRAMEEAERPAPASAETATGTERAAPLLDPPPTAREALANVRDMAQARGTAAEMVQTLRTIEQHARDALDAPPPVPPTAPAPSPAPSGPEAVNLERDWRPLMLLIAEACGEEDPEAAVADEYDPWSALRRLIAERRAPAPSGMTDLDELREIIGYLMRDLPTRYRRFSHIDHACAACCLGAPALPPTVPGFRCAYHLALDIVHEQALTELRAYRSKGGGK